MIRSAFAHEGAFSGGLAAGSTRLADAWTLDPLVLGALALALWLYARGTRRSWARAGVGRGVRPFEVASFGAGIAALFIALVWPLDALGERMFWAHMAQHMVMMNVAAPLLVLGAPLQAMIRALPEGARRRCTAVVHHRAWRGGWRRVSGTWAATLLQLVALWAWHTPRAVGAALASDPLHVAMHTSLLAVALLFWSAVLHPSGTRQGPAIGALLVTLKVTGLVSIVLLLQPGALYGAYGTQAAAWGLSPAEDEQLGWAVMMALGTLAYLGAAIALLVRAFARLDRAHPAGGGPALRARGPRTAP